MNHLFPLEVAPISHIKVQVPMLGFRYHFYHFFYYLCKVITKQKTIKRQQFENATKMLLYYNNDCKAHYSYYSHHKQIGANSYLNIETLSFTENIYSDYHLLLQLFLDI